MPNVVFDDALDEEKVIHLIRNMSDEEFDNYINSLKENND